MCRYEMVLTLLSRVHKKVFFLYQIVTDEKFIIIQNIGKIIDRFWPLVDLYCKIYLH